MAAGAAQSGTAEGATGTADATQVTGQDAAPDQRVGSSTGQQGTGASEGAGQQDSGQDGGAEGGQDGAESGAATETISKEDHQKELNRIATREAKKAETNAEKKLLERLGFESIEDAEATAEAMRLIEEETSTDVDRLGGERDTLKDENKTLKGERDTLQGRVQELEVSRDVERAMRKAGVSDHIEAAMDLAAPEIRKLIAENGADDIDEKDVSGVVAAVKGRANVFFNGPDLGGGANPGGGGGGGGGQGEEQDVWSMSTEQFNAMKERALNGETVKAPG